VNDSHDATLKRFEATLAAPDEAFYDLTLFVSGASELAARAINNTRNLCDLHMRGRYRLSVVDIHDDPGALLGSGVLATPTLVKNRPEPARRVVGDVSHTERVLRMLGLPVALTPRAG
jgi:circadian clock protein KaiB